MVAYLLLAMFVLCIILGLASFTLTTSSFYYLYTRKTAKPPRKARVIALLIIGLMCIIFTSVSWYIYKQLLHEHHHVLENFGIWYVIGFVSRLLLLAKRYEILSLHFATDWDEVYYSFIISIFGPLVTLHLIWILFIKREKNFWE